MPAGYGRFPLSCDGMALNEVCTLREARWLVDAKL
jgi:hypothetical protein